jgi:hypothetical protein
MSVVVPSEKQYDKAVERLSTISTPALISVKNSLVKNQKQDDILLIVKDKLAGLSNPQQYKLCNDFLLYVCKLVEAFFVKKDKADKKQVVLDIMRAVFGHNDTELKLVSTAVEFLFSNGLISKVKMSKSLKHSISNWFKKKLL